MSVAVPASARHSRTLLFACLGIVAALNALAPSIAEAFEQEGRAGAAAGLFGISAVFWFAGFALVTVARRENMGELDTADWWVAGVSALMILLPIAHLAAPALLLLALRLQFGGNADAGSRKVAFILFALTGPLLWGKLLMALFAAPVLRLDAFLVHLVTGAEVDGNVVAFSTNDNTQHNTSFMIASGCSAVRNISLATVLWACLVQLFDVPVTRRLVLACVAAALAMLLVNVARLGAIQRFPDQFDMLHVGIGATLFGWAGVLAAWAINSAAVLHEIRLRRA